MMKRFSILLAAILLLVVPSTALGAGRVDLTLGNHEILQDGSVRYEAVITNTGDMPVYGIEIRSLRVLDVNGNLLAAGSFGGPYDSLSRTRLANGQSIQWSFFYRSEHVHALPKSGIIEAHYDVVYYQSPDILLNGRVLEPIDVPAILRVDESRTYLPIRSVAQALGASVDWDQAEQKATLTKGNTVVNFWIGKKTYSVNGTLYTMDAAPWIYQDRTLVPVRYAAQALGLKVDFDGRVLLSD